MGFVRHARTPDRNSRGSRAGSAGKLGQVPGHAVLTPPLPLCAAVRDEHDSLVRGRAYQAADALGQDLQHVVEVSLLTVRLFDGLNLQGGDTVRQTPDA